MKVPSVLVCEDRSIVEDLLYAIGEIESALKGQTKTVAPIREARKDADATGAWLSSSDRIVHRVAGLSKPNPPLDPFRVGSGRARKADGAQRGDDKGFVRREILHVSRTGFETSIVVSARRPFAMSPDKDDAVWRMRIQLGMIADVVKEARFATSHPGPARVAAAYACGVLDALREPPIRGAIAICVMPSPLGNGGVKLGGLTMEDVDGEAMPMVDPNDWPHGMRLLHSATATSRSWTLTQLHGDRRLVDIDPMDRLRIMREGTPSFMDYLEHGEPIR
jgi:hypothetical protein